MHPRIKSDNIVTHAYIHDSVTQLLTIHQLSDMIRLLNTIIVIMASRSSGTIEVKSNI